MPGLNRITTGQFKPRSPRFLLNVDGDENEKEKEKESLGKNTRYPLPVPVPQCRW
jgi:hypothetical protein